MVESERRPWSRCSLRPSSGRMGRIRMLRVWVQLVTITVFFLSQSKPSRVGRIYSMQGQRQVTVSDVGCPTLRQLAGAVQTIGGPDALHTADVARPRPG